jgi:hypothetical protein
LNNINSISFNLTEFKVGTPTAHSTAVCSVDMDQIDFRWLARSMFELGHLAIGGHVVRYDLHDCVSDLPAKCDAQRSAKIEKQDNIGWWKA